MEGLGLRMVQKSELVRVVVNIFFVSTSVVVDCDFDICRKGENVFEDGQTVHTATGRTKTVASTSRSASLRDRTHFFRALRRGCENDHNASTLVKTHWTNQIYVRRVYPNSHWMNEFCRCRPSSLRLCPATTASSLRVWQFFQCHECCLLSWRTDEMFSALLLCFGGRRHSRYHRQR